LQPHRSEYWCIPPEADAEFVCAMETVLETYQLPYRGDEPVVCFDERSVQLIAEVIPPLEAEPATEGQAGTPERVDYEYERRGTADVFLFTEPLAGWRHGAVTEQRRRSDLAEQLRRLVDERYPDARRIKLVCDNLNTHSGACLYEAFAPAEARRILSKLEFVYTPKHGSWLNIAECELSALSRQCLDRRIDSIEELRSETAAWEAGRNAAQTGVDWQFTAADARIKLKRLYPKFQS
jgi:DDE superfamily endonuclease